MTINQEKQLDHLRQRLEVEEFFDYQLETFAAWQQELEDSLKPRMCLYHRTGAGKTITSLTCMAIAGETKVLVIAPPATHSQWILQGVQVGIDVTPISHAKFRMPDYRVERGTPIICDEFHLLGGHKGKGWRKFEKMSAHLMAPLIICSATPNYNDAERCYCIQRVVNRSMTTGGYLQFLYANCSTEQNPFGMEPKVTGFLQYKDAASYLAAQPRIHYLPDTTKWEIVDLPFEFTLPPGFNEYNYNIRNHRIMASGMEKRWGEVFHAYLDQSEQFNDAPYELLIQIAGESTTPLLVFCNSGRIARALSARAFKAGTRTRLVTGKSTNEAKDACVQDFKNGDVDILIGTATLATGVDGLDKVCDTMVIVNDTDDPSLRRQLVGRILPRGADADASRKKIYRLVPHAS